MSSNFAATRPASRLSFGLLLGISWVIYAGGLGASCVMLGPERATTVGLGSGILMAALQAWALRREPAGEVGATEAPPRWPVILVFLAAAAPAAWVWNQGQLIPDEGTYAFQARQILTGRLSSLSPLTVLPDTPAARKSVGFIHTIHHNGRWFGKYPPGWPLVLAAGQALQIDWLVNVLLAALLIAVTGKLAGDLATPMAGWLAALLMASSPYFWFTVMGRMSHVTSGLLLAAAAWLALRGVRARALAPLAGAFACVGAATMVRPYTAAVMGGLICALALAALRQTPLLRPAVALAAGLGLLTLALNAGFNLLQTGSAFVTPYSLYAGVEGIPMELRHTLSTIRDNVVNGLRWSMMNSVLFTGPLTLFAAIFALRKGSPHRAAATCLALLALSLIAAHIFTTMPPGGRWGSRFHSEGAFAYLALAGIGAAEAASRLSRRRLWQLVAVFLAAQALTLLIYFPHYMEDGRPVGRMRAAAADLPHTRATVFLASEGDPRTLAIHFNPNAADWAHAPHVYLVDPGAEARAALACALERPAWILLAWNGSRRVVERQQGVFTCPAR